MLCSSKKKALKCNNCNKPDHSIETCLARGSGKGPRQRRDLNPRRKRKYKANIAKETFGEDKDDGLPLSTSVLLIKDGSGDTIIT